MLFPFLIFLLTGLMSFYIVFLLFKAKEINWFAIICIMDRFIFGCVMGILSLLVITGQVVPIQQVGLLLLPVCIVMVITAIYLFVTYRTREK